MLLWTVAACGAAPIPAAAPAAPARPARNRRHRIYEGLVAAPRPALAPAVADALPDPTRELRWPLAPTVHPELEPQYPIAARLADPGVTWHDLCALGAQHRHVPGRGAQLVEYLAGWCSAAAHDDDEAVAQLTGLEDSTIAGLADAVPIDLAAILADAGGADDAEHLIAKYDIRDVSVLDDLAAVYVELDRPEDARAINADALDLGAHSREADQCHRAARDIVLGPSLSRKLEIADLKRVHITGRKIPDPTCTALYDELDCWISPGVDCRDYFRAHGTDGRFADLLGAYLEWPQRPAAYAQWLQVATDAVKASGLPGATELADTALRAAVATSGCSFHKIDELGTVEAQLGAAPPVTAPVVHAAFTKLCLPH